MRILRNYSDTKVDFINIPDINMKKNNLVTTKEFFNLGDIPKIVSANTMLQKVMNQFIRLDLFL